MNTNDKLKTLIKEAKDGGKQFSSINKSDTFFTELKEYAGQREPNSFPAKYGIVLGHSEHCFMMLLDEINLMQREINILNQEIKNLKS